MKEIDVKYAAVLALLLFALAVIVAGRVRADDELEQAQKPDIEISAPTLKDHNSELTRITGNPETTENSVGYVLCVPEKLPDDQISEPGAKRQRVAKYAGLEVTQSEIDLMAAVIYLEAGNQSFEGQQAVAEVILNRCMRSGFPDNVNDVLWQENQFSVMPFLSLAAPTQTQYDAIDAALYGDSILPVDVVFFSCGAENDRVWGQIGDHIFCFEYIWG